MSTDIRTLPQILNDRARREPERVAQRHKTRGVWREYRFAEVQDQVRALALGLAEAGLARGETLAVIGENEPPHFWSELAALAVGAKVISLYPDLTADEVWYLLDDSEAVCVVAQDQEQVDKLLEIRERVPGLRLIIYWDGSGMWSYGKAQLHDFADVQAAGRTLHRAAPQRYEAMIAEGSTDDVAVLSYTSGTTGRPKGVMLTHRYMVDNASRVQTAAGLSPGTEYLSFIAPAWATEQFIGMTLGLLVPMVVNFPESPDQVQANLRELAVEAVVFAPRQWESLAASLQARLLDAPPWRRRLYDWALGVGRRVRVVALDGGRPDWWSRVLHPLADALILRPVRDQLGLTRVKLPLCGGSTMAPDAFRMFHSVGIPLRNVYGSTEIGLMCMHQGSRYNLETVGHWLSPHPQAGPALEHRVSDAGELLIRGGSPFLGYYRKPEKTAERLSDGWYRTGDAVTISASGEVLFLDRIEDLRTLRTGERYPPQFLETKLRFSHLIKDVMTLGDLSRDYVTALINIDMDYVSRWAEERNLSFSTFTDLSQLPEVAELVRAEIARINALLPEASQIRRFANFPKELDPDEGELTRTRKLRREALAERYHALIEGLYGGAQQVDLKIPVTYQDGSKGHLQAHVHIHDVAKLGTARGVAKLAEATS